MRPSEELVLKPFASLTHERALVAAPCAQAERASASTGVEASSVVLCTRNRGKLLRRALGSILANEHPSFGVVVVDQSTNDEAEESIIDLKRDSRLTYVRSQTVGLSRARNIGLRMTGTPVVAFADDDTEVPRDWLATMQRVMNEHPQAALVYCSVRAGPHDPYAGFVPVYECRGTRIVRTIEDKRAARGMGAGLAVRRDVLLKLDGFDEQLGAGGQFPSCEDWDMTIRALLASFEVCETDRTFVIHHGFRGWAEVKALSRRTWTGMGAAFAKPLRAGHWRFAPVALYELVTMAMGPPVNDLLHLRLPRGMKRSFHFMQGFSRGLKAPFDRDRLLFKSAAD
jgi:GT2 family glycosyltransferase